MLAMRLHEKLKRLCGERRWGQTDLIEAVGDISKSTMNNWFNGKSKPDLESALKIAKAFDVPLDWLADPGAEYPPPHDEPSPQEASVLKLIRALQLDEDEALRRLATPAATGAAWLPGAVRTFTESAPPPRPAEPHYPDAVTGRVHRTAENPDGEQQPKPKRKRG